MKKYGKSLSFLLVMALLLAGCTVTPDSTKMTAQVIGNGETTAPATGETANVEVQYLPKKVENPDNLPVLKWLCLVDNVSTRKAYEKTWNEDVGNEINRMLEAKNMPFRLQIVLLKGKGAFLDWFSTPECQEALPDADLLYGGFLYPDQEAAYLAPLTEYIKGENPVLQNAVPADIYWIPHTWEGEIYGISGEVLYPRCEGWSIDQELLASSGLSPEDIARDYWDMDAVFDKLLEANGQQTFLDIPATNYYFNDVVHLVIPSIMASYDRTRFSSLTACYALDYSQERPEIINMPDSAYFRKVRVTAKQYTDAGYGEDYNALGDPNRKRRMSPADSVLSDRSYVNKSNSCMIPTGDLLVDPLYGGRVSGITKTTDQKENAVMLLQLIAEDAEFRRLLCFGREGQEYTLENGVYIPNEGKNFYDMSFLTVMSFFSGMDTGFLAPKEEGEDLLETHRKLLAKSKVLLPLSGDFGFAFNDILEEIEAVNQIVKDSSDVILTMTDEQYNKFIADIRAAGGDKIQAELQRQLDEWLEENPDWLQ